MVSFAPIHRSSALRSMPLWRVCAVLYVCALLWNASYTLLHHAVVEHVRCQTHGEWLHADALQSASGHHAHTSETASYASEESFLAHAVCTLFFAGFYPAYAVYQNTVSSVRRWLAWAASYATCIPPVASVVIYALAPKNSPPFFSF